MNRNHPIVDTTNARNVWFKIVRHDIDTYLLMELSPSQGAANYAARQELPSILWNPKEH
jgi:hypothetical protein